MIKYVYKADNMYGDERTGTIIAPSESDARRLLREKGLVSTFLEDIKVYKHKRRVRKRRRRLIIRTGAGLISIAIVASVWMARAGNRDAAPDVSALVDSGVLRGHAGTIVADSPELQSFAHRIVEAWNSFTPGLITGIEVQKNLMSLYVSSSVKNIGDDDMEVLATNSLRALQREFKASGVTMLIIEDELTIMELYYSPFTRSMKIRDHR